MAMLDKCKQVVRAKAQELGREGLKDSDLKAISDRLDSTMRRMAQEDPKAWMQKPQSLRVSLAAERIISDLQHEAARKVENVERQALASIATDNRIKRIQDSYRNAPGHDGTRAEALKQEFNLADQDIKSIRREAMGNLMATIEAAGDKQGAGMGRKLLMTLFDAENPLMTRDLTREIFANADGHTGNKAAQEGARAWLDSIENLRQRFNLAGGDVRQLQYGYIPQPHDVSKVRKATAEGWVEKTLPLLDRRRYLREDGTRMDDNEVKLLLANAWESIATEGQNKTEPGQFVSPGKRANKGQDERQIHFKDGDAYIAYMRQFGSGSMFDAMMGHVSGMARDIGLVERYGPDPSAQARLQFDLAKREDGNQVGLGSINPETYWKIISGQTGMPESEPLSRLASTVRNIMTAAKLGGALFTSFADLGTIAVTAGYNRLPYFQLLKDISISHGREAKELMASHGMIAESLEHALNRWSGDQLSGSWSGKMANSVMKWSLLNAWTDGLRQGFKMTMNAKLAELAKKPWAELTEFDRRHLTRGGISEADWAVLNKVQPTVFRGRELLTPDAIRATGAEGSVQLANRILGFVQDESEYAVVNPDIRTRAITTFGGLQAGTVGGEIARSVMQFKSFPIAMLTRHWTRALESGAEGGPMVANRYAYAMALMATLTGLGAITVQSKQMLQGQDPIDMRNPRFWAKAAASGGAWGIAGDLVLVDPSNSAGDSMGTLAKNLAGPAIGTVGELIAKDVIENGWQFAEGKDTHVAAELAQWVKSNTPGASLWWVRPMIDHGFMNQMNEAMSPGYLGRMQQRAYQNWGAQYFWAPQDAMPDRAPDLAKAVGQ